MRNGGAAFNETVSVISMAASGGNVTVIWGYETGAVAVTAAPRVMDQARFANRRFTLCNPQDRHSGAVNNISQCIKTSTFVTGCSNGMVKLWSSKSARCLWTHRRPMNEYDDPCLQTAYDSASGTIVAAFCSGILAIWILGPISDNWSELNHGILQPIKILVPPELKPDELLPFKQSATLHLSSSPSEVKILVHFEEDLQFSRISVQLGEDGMPMNIGPAYTKTQFGEGPLAGLTALALDAVASQSLPLQLYVPSPFGDLAIGRPSHVPPRPVGLVIGGDAIGRLCVWKWDDPGVLGESGVMEVKSTRHIEAHDDGGVCVIQVSAHVWVTGSTHGSIAVFDALTLAAVRFVPNPNPRPTGGMAWPKVEQLVVDKDECTLVASVGSRILYWNANRSEKKRKGVVLGSTVVATYKPSMERRFQKLEIKDAVRESKYNLDREREKRMERQHVRKEQLNVHDTLGLNEAEAMEYALMLSREEAEQSASIDKTSNASPTEGIATPVKGRGRAIATSHSPSPSSQSAGPESPVTPAFGANPAVPRSKPPGSKPKTLNTARNATTTSSPSKLPQILSEEEAMEYALMLSREEANQGVLIDNTSTTSVTDVIATPVKGKGHVAAASRSLSPSSLSAGSDTLVASAFGTNPGPSEAGSSKTAFPWKTTTKPRRSKAKASNIAKDVRLPSSPSEWPQIPSAGASSLTDGSTRANDLDDDIRFAIELSLAEAKSKEENDTQEWE